MRSKRLDDGIRPKPQSIAAYQLAGRREFRLAVVVNGGWP
jgi:hypothetical protein